MRMISTERFLKNLRRSLIQTLCLLVICLQRHSGWQNVSRGLESQLCRGSHMKTKTVSTTFLLLSQDSATITKMTKSFSTASLLHSPDSATSRAQFLSAVATHRYGPLRRNTKENQANMYLDVQQYLQASGSSQRLEYSTSAQAPRITF